MNGVDLALLVTFSPLMFVLLLHSLYMISSIRGSERGTGRASVSPGLKRVRVVIPIKSEPAELVLEGLKYLGSLLGELRESFGVNIDIHVVSDDDEIYVDRLRKEIAGLGATIPVEVVRRSDGSGGRVAALNFSLLNSKDVEAMIILDVDARPTREFFEEMLSCSQEADACVGHWVGYWSRETRIARTIAFSTDLAATALYRGRKALGLLVFPLGSGTLFKTRALEAVGGWESGTVQDDVIIGMKLHGTGHRISYSSRALVKVLVPSSYRAFRIQQLKWAYGALESLKYSLKHLNRERVGLVKTLEARLYTLQYLPALSTLLTSIIVPSLSLILAEDVSLSAIVLAELVPALYVTTVLKVLKARYGTLTRVLRTLGSISAIGLAVAPVVAKGVLLGVLGVKPRAPVTPKGEEDRENYREYVEEYVIMCLSLALGVTTMIKGYYFASLLGLLPLLASAYTFLRATKPASAVQPTEPGKEIQLTSASSRFKMGSPSELILT